VNTKLANELARICAYSAEAPEWEEFLRVTMPVVSLTVWRVAKAWGDVSQATLNEITQDVFLKLCEDERRVLRKFEDRGEDSILKLLRVISASVATDYFRRVVAEKRGGPVRGGEPEKAIAIDDVPDGRGTEAIEWPAFLSQLDGLLRRNLEAVTERDRTLFWLYYRQGMTADAISHIPAMGLGRKGVESALRRLTRLLQQAVEGQTETERSKRLHEANKKGFSAVVAIDSVKRR
jgi:RNA polymerase sigma-70 factor, ECF subfamily